MRERVNQGLLISAVCFFLMLLACLGIGESAFPAAPPGTSRDLGPEKIIRLSAGERSWLARHKPLRVAFDGYFPPYSFLNDEGKFEGLAVDVMRVLAGRIGVTIEPSPKAVWKDLYEAAQRREVDVVATMGRQPERQKWFVFTRPYIFKSLVIMTRSENADVIQPEDLAGKRVALVKSYQYVKALLEQYPSIQPFYVGTMLDGLNAVAVGKADAAITFLGAGHYLQTKYQIANLKFAAIYDRDRFSESIAVRKDWPELAAILDKALDSLSGQEMLALQEKWLPAEDLATRKIALTPEEKAWIRDHPVIRLGIDPEFAPFEYLSENGAYSGIASDYVKLLNQRLGLNMKVVPGLTWKEAVEKAKKREIDLLPSVGMTEERKIFLNYSEPYIHFHRVIITRTEIPFLTGLDDIRDLKVAVQADSSHEGFLKEKTDIQPLTYATLKKAILAVADGKADAFVGNIASSTYWIRKLNLTNLKVAAPVSGEVDSLHFAVRKDWPELKEIINKGLASITPAEQTEIRQRWVAVEYSPGIAPGTVWKYLALLLGIVLLSAGGFTIWNRSLKRRVDRKTEEVRRELAERKKITAALRESEQKFRHYFESANLGFALTSPEKGWLLVNPYLCSMFGYSEEEFFGKNWAEMTHPEDLEPDVQQFNRLLTGEIDGYKMDKRFFRKDGGLIYTHLTVSCSRDLDGTVKFVIATLEDITERKKAEKDIAEAHQRLVSTIESMTDAFISLDKDWCYTYMNKKAGQIFQRDPESMIGKHIWTEFPESVDQPFCRAYYKAVEEQRFIHLEEYYPPYDRWFENRIYPSKDGLAIFFSDITERKQAEEELEKHRNHLEELVGERTNDLERAQQALRFLLEDVNQSNQELVALNKRLKELDRLKSIFLASMSHELRTPLNSIIGFTGIILMGMTGDISREQRKQLTLVKSNAHHLLSLINDVLDISKIEAGKVEILCEEFSLDEVVETIAASFTPVVQDKGIELVAKTDSGIRLVSDKRRVLQILVNLMSNAVKFTERGSVRIDARLCKEDQVEIRVGDTGIGIKAESMEVLFEPFQQAGVSLTKKYEGTGLGLYLCKKLSGLLGGRLSARSRFGEGSEFTVILPLRYEGKGHETDTTDRGQRVEHLSGPVHP